MSMLDVIKCYDHVINIDRLCKRERGRVYVHIKAHVHITEMGHN